MQKIAQEGWQQELAYTISKLKEIEEWIMSEADPEIQQEMMDAFTYTLNQVQESINMSSMLMMDNKLGG